MPSRDIYDANKEKYREESVEYYLKHKVERDQINKNWGKNNPEKLKVIKARYRAKNKEKLNKYNSDYNKKYSAEIHEKRENWRRSSPEKDKNARLMLNYGITYETYRGILQNQCNRCGICNVEFKGTYKFPDLRSTCVDHDHFNRKEIRGVLCRGCNSGIGLFDDSPFLLGAALLWLTKGEYDVVFDKGWANKKRVREPLFNRISKDQGNKCGICLKDLSGVRTNLDHNHSSMRVRGLLCAKCNKALGFLGDDLVRIKNSIIWLTEGRIYAEES